MHGPALQGLKAIRRGSKGVLAKVKLPEKVKKTWGEYVLHPSLLDSALQAAVALMGEEGVAGETQLPFALERLRIMGRCPQDVLAWAKYGGKRESGGERV